MFGILVDVTKCTGCERCVTACVESNGLDPARADIDRFTTVDGLSANRLSSVVRVSEGRFSRKSCMHCVEPACVSACLVGGITKTEEGPVVYDPARCIGCRYCMLACPFHIPRYEWDRTRPFITKCDMCYDEVKKGGLPACVEACPNGALEFGQRDRLLEVAQSRIRHSPGKYVDHVWGRNELGGTAVLYISDVDLSALDFPARPEEAIPEITEPLIASTPVIGLTVASGLLGINWVIRRRMKLASRQNESSPGGDGTTAEGEHDGS